MPPKEIIYLGPAAIILAFTTFKFITFQTMIKNNNGQGAGPAITLITITYCFDI